MSVMQASLKSATRMRPAVKWLSGFLLLASLAYLGNAVRIPLFFGVDLVFGSIAVLLAIPLLGVPASVAIVALGGLQTVVLWGHPYALLVFALEAVLVGAAYRKSGLNLALLDVVFWLLVGGPLAVVLYHLALAIPLESAFKVALKMMVNGTFNAVVASFLIMAVQAFSGSRRRSQSRPRFFDLLFLILLGLTLTAGATPVLYYNFQERIESETRIEQSLVRVGDSLAQRIQREPGAGVNRYAMLINRAQSDRNMGIGLIGENGRILAQEGNLRTRRDEPASVLSRSGLLKAWLPDEGDSLINRWKEASYFYEVPVARVPGVESIVVEYRARPIISSMSLSQLQAFLFLAVLISLGAVVAFLISRQVVRPLHGLSEQGRYLPERIANDQFLRLPNSSIREFADLTKVLQSMGGLLSSSFQQLKRARAHLEDQVAERTEALQSTADLLRNVLEAASEIGIIATDRFGRITLFNYGAERLLGYRSAEVVDQLMLTHFFDGDELEQRRTELDEIGERAVSEFEVLVHRVQTEGSDTAEWNLLDRQGNSIPVSVTMTPMLGADGELTGYLCVAEDITERRRIDRMKNEFVSTVSHELRTPLTSISGSLGLIHGGALGELSEDQARMLSMAKRNTDRLAHLVNDLLDMDKLLSGKMQFDIQSQALDQLIRDSVQLNESFGAERGVRVHCEEPLPEGSVSVDRQRMTQALSNLLSNAIKFSPDDSTVTVSARRSGPSFYDVVVQDQGPGVDPAFQNRLFQKFAQGDSSDTRQQGGTGLGLAITQELMYGMGGDVGYEPSDSQGAIFWLRVPLTREASSL